MGSGRNSTTNGSASTANFHRIPGTGTGTGTGTFTEAKFEDSP
jgi:hypothetical protein